VGNLRLFVPCLLPLTKIQLFLPFMADMTSEPWIQGKNKSVHPIISLAIGAPKRDLLRPPLLRSSKRLRSGGGGAAATSKKQTTGDQSLENKPTVVVYVHSS
jgi:hypothetical protein